MHPQIVDPFSTGFAENEFLVIKVTDTDQLGQLYEAMPRVDDKGKPLPPQWRGTTKMLFPTSETANKVKSTPIEQVRYAFEKVGGATKLTAAAVAELSISADAAYKYESKSDSADRIDAGTLQYAPAGTKYMEAKLAKEKDCQFAYLSAIYRGTAFVEVLSNNNSSGGGSYAAFQMGSDYYVSRNNHIATSGPIIFQLTPIDPEEVDVQRPGVTATRKTRISPLTPQQLSEIRKSLPEKLRPMME